MDQGRLAQVAPPAEIYERPNSRWVADFLGEVTMIEGRMAEAGIIETAVGKLRVAAGAGKQGETVWLALRPEKIRLRAEHPVPETNVVSGTIAEVGYRGDMSIYKVRLADRSLMKVAVANTGARGQGAYAANDPVWLSWSPDAGVVLTR
jgi:putrescine transport system ATP-binding protein